LSSKPLVIEAAPIGKTYYMSTNASGTIRVNFAEDSLGYNAGKSLVAAIGKTGSSLPLTAHEEYAIEGLWHEILHNQSINTSIKPSMRGQAHDTIIIEAVNQLVARRTYAKFMQELTGIAACHTEWVLTEGYGYNFYVTNLRTLLDLLAYEDAFIEHAYKELMLGYQDFTDRISDILSTNSGSHHPDEITELFTSIDSPKFTTSLEAKKRSWTV
jgi:hypothetical protein